MIPSVFRPVTIESVNIALYLMNHKVGKARTEDTVGTEWLS